MIWKEDILMFKVVFILIVAMLSFEISILQSIVSHLKVTFQLEIIYSLLVSYFLKLEALRHPNHAYTKLTEIKTGPP